MPNLSASDYTNYLKYKTAAVAYADNRPPRAIQTVDQVAPNIAIINSIVKASEASFRTNPTVTSINGLASVRPMPPNIVNHPNAKSSLSYAGMGPAASLPAAAGGKCCGPEAPTN
jgi:hypothetical protein